MADNSTEDLLISEIFASIQGESSYVGLPCVMVRLSGCNLRCTYCDTPYAFADGEKQRRDDVLARVDACGLQHVEITGGEPLLQPASLSLMRVLCDRGYTVLLETNGSLDISGVDPRVIRIVDIKTPSSGVADRNLWRNLETLRSRDEVKFVLADRGDYEWAVDVMRRRDLAATCAVLMGPTFGVLAPATLAQWIVADRLPVRLQVQLHKVIWNHQARGV
jgi:7-carboxy-7-deazaguanine synthase